MKLSKTENHIEGNAGLKIKDMTCTVCLPFLIEHLDNVFTVSSRVIEIAII